MHCSKKASYSITSSASGKQHLRRCLRPSALAVLRLIANSSLVGSVDRQIGGLRAIENPPNINSKLAVDISEVDAITHQAAGRSMFPKLVHRRHSKARRVRNNPVAAVVEEWIGSHDKRGNTVLLDRFECRRYFGISTGSEDLNL